MTLRSIRGRLTVLLLASTLLLLATGGSAGWLVVRSRIVREFDRVLEAETRGLMVLTAREGDKIEADFEEWSAARAGESGGEDDEDEDEDEDENGDDEDEAEAEDVDGEGGETYFQLFLEDGTVVRKSDGLGERDLPRAGEEGVLFRDLALPGRENGRLVQVTYFPEIDEVDPETALDEELFALPPHYHGKPVKLVLVVARDREHLEELLNSLALSFGALGLFLVGGLALVIRIALRRGFKPLHAFQSQVRGIGPNSLDQRVALADPPSELEGAVAAINGLLDRVESGFARERRFSDDVAHELRTPLAELLAACEVGEKWPDDPEATRELFSGLRESAVHLRNVVTTLLELARCDGGAVALARQKISLKEMLKECWERTAPCAGPKGMAIEVPEGELVVESDPDRLRMVLQNILDNAVVHGAPGSTITCVLGGGDAGVLEVSNPAVDLSAEDVRHVFERFWRKDSARTASGQGGLGLSIVQALCHLLGIEVEARLGEEGRFVIALAFPPRAAR